MCDDASSSAGKRYFVLFVSFAIIICFINFEMDLSRQALYGIALSGLTVPLGVSAILYEKAAAWESGTQSKKNSWLSYEELRRHHIEGEFKMRNTGFIETKK